MKLHAKAALEAELDNEGTELILQTKDQLYNSINVAENIDEMANNGVNTDTLVVNGRRAIKKKHVADELRRAVMTHGISPIEKNRLDAGIHWMRKRHNQLVFITVASHDASEGEVRNLIRRVKSDLAQAQRRCGVPVHWIEVLESAQQVHSHIIASLPIARAKRLYSYAYGPQLKVDPIKDIIALRNYLLKEGTPQALFRTSIRRINGSHKLGKGGGDRIKFSNSLNASLLKEGHIQPIRRTYAARGLS